MKYVKVGAACPVTTIANIDENIKNIKHCINEAKKESCKVLVFPELSITSYSCGDLFNQTTLISKSLNGLKDLCHYSENLDMVIAVGCPIIDDYTMYNCAVIIFNGSILGIMPKSYLPNYSEFYEKRWFTEGINIKNSYLNLGFQNDIPFGTNLIFSDGALKLSFETCEDLWAPISPSSYLTLSGANVIGNLSASNELVSKQGYRKSLLKSQSAKTISAYIYASAGVFESTTDVLFSGYLSVLENGSIIKENKRFQRENEVICSVIDLEKLEMERVKNVTFRDSAKLIKDFSAKIINFNFSNDSYGEFDRYVDPLPFVPSNEEEREERCKEIFSIQCNALAKRLTHTHIDKAVIGISGGLDSTLALLVVIKTFDLLNIPRKNITTITLPGFGTTDRTYHNAVNLCKEFGCSFREINIVEAALKHFQDIGHDPSIHDVTYENVQARERTQILMDISNKIGGLTIGTGDLSELALGWATFNGDHMSMYSVNCSIPKTLVRYLVDYVADHEVSSEISYILKDILDTPVSPELLPKDENGNIAQKTEDIVGPYELHDFFLYHFIKEGASYDKLLFLAKVAFKDIYDEETIEKWLIKFIKRFFTQQFKRSTLPDGPKVGSISLSPRGDWRMPSDASYESFLK
ncbi:MULTISPECIES: NAD(+) synthase [Clostridium]|uniref:Glutamine-dependent NAD(+) synthetase n=1 Tax=Clostridium cadaveris TaxID=1529 RepID=A0A1I2J250_9CLOT|nr:NAD(+) synthase [Clostridium cadaveris]MDU4951551.1 NAD(+) synthase [Clostridium sp.]MDM8311370.1 NAD(+) synthase [Clostridium cadaveris]MDY4950522.1 NAD(+) synthase [Clostridium cadaveris]NME63278.1 NAD(+) synthase [Clostridium cadaveris]UFH63564.1 NAD(+) synthase [Clostridium cadaveris]